MKFAQIKDLAVAELRKKRTMWNAELFELRMKHSMGQLNNPLQIRQLRRRLAQLNTALTQRAYGVQPQHPAPQTEAPAPGVAKTAPTGTA